MSKSSGPFVVAVVTQEETRMWFAGIDHGAEHETVKERNPFDRHNHVRMAQHNGGHDIDEYMPDYLESISEALKPAGEILLITHGKGKANAVPVLTDYFKKKLRK
jgi:cyclopropane fatty-acyl-phospholipid synthase-like methyltransferase